MDQFSTIQITAIACSLIVIARTLGLYI